MADNSGSTTLRLALLGGLAAYAIYALVLKKGTSDLFGDYRLGQYRVPRDEPAHRIGLGVSNYYL